LKKLIITLVFEKNAIFVCRKCAKIAEDCDHNIGPWSPCRRTTFWLFHFLSFSRVLFFSRQQKQKQVLVITLLRYLCGHGGPRFGGSPHGPNLSWHNLSLKVLLSPATNSAVTIPFLPGGGGRGGGCEKVKGQKAEQQSGKHFYFQRKAKMPQKGHTPKSLFGQSSGGK
jgi:hypothetical protein